MSQLVKNVIFIASNQVKEYANIVKEKVHQAHGQVTTRDYKKLVAEEIHI